MESNLESSVNTSGYIEDIEDSNDAKAELRRDVFSTEKEAADRAEEIGCVGTHSHDEDGQEVFMPCKTHEEYIDKVGMDVRQDDHHQEVKAEIKAYHDDEDEDKQYGKFEGYGSVFGNKDLGNDVIQSGAFAKSLKRKKPKDVKLLYQHKSEMPIGVFDEIKEDFWCARVAIINTSRKRSV